MSTPTPRTDADTGIYGYDDAVSADFARTLEREVEELKDEFRRNEAQILNACGKSHMSYPAINGVMEIAKERDQLKQQLASSKSLDEILMAEKEMTSLRQQLESQNQELITRGMEIAAERENCERLTQQLLAAQLREGKP